MKTKAFVRWGLSIVGAVFITSSSESCHRSAAPLDTSDPARLAIEIRARTDHQRYQAAVDLALPALRDHPDDADLLKAASRIYSFQGATQENGASAFQNGIDVLNHAIDVGIQDAEVYGRLGYLLDASGKRAKAIDSYLTALELSPGDSHTMVNLGALYKKMGMYEKALPWLTKATRFPLESGSSMSAHVPWFELGDDQRLLGEYDISLQSMEKARELAPAQTKDELSQCVEFTKTLLVDKDNWTAFWNHYSLAQRHGEVRRWDRSKAEFEKMLSLPPHDDPANRTKQLGWAHLCLAMDFSRLNQFEQSRDYSLTAIELLSQSNVPKLLANAYEQLAEAYDRLPRVQLSRLKNADPLTVRLESRKKQLEALTQAEQYYLQAGNTDAAKDVHISMAYQRAWVYGVNDPIVEEVRRELQKQIPPTGDLEDEKSFMAGDWEADFRELAKDDEGALELHFRTEKYLDSVPPERRWDGLVATYVSIANEVYQIRGDLDASIRYREKAIQVAESIRERMDNDRFRRSAVTGYFQNACSSLVSLCLKKKDPEKAFHYAELYKGRALLDLLSSDSIVTLSHSYHRKEREQRNSEIRVSKLHDEMKAAASAKSGDASGSLERDLAVEQTNYQRLSEDVSVSKLELSNIRTAEVAGWEDIRPLVRGVTIIDYVIMPKEFNSALIITEEGIQGVPLPITNGRQLQPLVDAFRSEIGVKSATSRDLNIEKPSDAIAAGQSATPHDVGAAGKKLWELLISPVLPYIKTEHVVISSYDVLNYVPFEALQDADGHFFIESHSVSYTPSVTVLKLCMAKDRHGKSSVLALGNPNLQNPAFRLFNAESEVKALEGMFPKVDVLTYDAATETAFKRRASQYDILHFACHGELNLDDPMLTSLRLAPDAENDGYLHTGELFELNLSASLAVLSACNTAVGELRTGNDVMGLTRGFFYAGVPSILASLWTVDDRSTAFLMEQFYKNLATMDKAQALRQAKLSTMKEFPSPFHWAPFCLQGDFH